MIIEGRSKPQPLTVEERNLFSVAVRNLVYHRRSSYKVLKSIERKAMEKQNYAEALRVRQKMNRVQQEVRGILDDTISLITRVRLPDDSPESQVFFGKMLGDQWRYLAECCPEESLQHHKAVQFAYAAFHEAKELADIELPPTHPVRLGLALNYSVFLIEVRYCLGKLTYHPSS